MNLKAFERVAMLFYFPMANTPPLKGRLFDSATRGGVYLGKYIMEIIVISFLIGFFIYTQRPIDCN